MLFSLLLLVTLGQAFLVYDCSTPDPQGIFQLLNGEGCHHKYPPTSKETSVTGSLVQIPRTIRIPAKSTRIEVRHESTYCTYFRLRTKLVISANYHSPSVSSVTPSTVLSWLKTGQIRLGHNTAPLVMGKEIIFIDSTQVDAEGFCTVKSKTIHYAVYSIFIQPTHLTEVLDKKGLTVSRAAFGEPLTTSGIRGAGALSDGTIVTWDPSLKPDCPWEHIFSGTFLLASDQGIDKVAVFESLSAGLILKEVTHICGAEVYSTSDSQLYVSLGHTIKAPPLDVSSPASWSSLIRTSIQYQGTIGALQMNNLTQTVEINQCLLEQKLQRDIIYSAATSPELVGYRLTGELGTAVVVSGAAIQLLKCLAQEAQLEPQPTCFDMVPIRLTSANKSAYMDPVTFVIRNSASQVSCQDPQVPFFEVRGGWYRLIPHKTMVTPPQVLPSDLEAVWNISIPTYIGLYPEEVLGHEETKWLYRDQREATLNGLLNWGNKEIGDNTQSALLDGLSTRDAEYSPITYNHWLSVSTLVGFLMLWMLCLTLWIGCLHKTALGSSGPVTSITAVTVPLISTDRLPSPAPRSVHTRAQILENLASWET